MELLLPADFLQHRDRKKTSYAAEVGGSNRVRIAFDVRLLCSNINDVNSSFSCNHAPDSTSV